MIGSNVYSETLSSFFFTNSVILATSLVRSHVIFKFLNYVTNKIVRVMLTTLALMLRCVQTMCVCEGETECGKERESRLCAFRTS